MSLKLVARLPHEALSVHAVFHLFHYFILLGLWCPLSQLPRVFGSNSFFSLSLFCVVVVGALSIFRWRLIFYATKVDIRDGCVSWEYCDTFKVSQLTLIGFICFTRFLFSSRSKQNGLPTDNIEKWMICIIILFDYYSPISNWNIVFYLGIVWRLSFCDSGCGCACEALQ